MDKYAEMTGLERFDAVEKLGAVYFETKRWKTEFARRYDVSVQAIQNWRNIGAPVWVCVALEDAIAAKEFDAIMILLDKHVNN